MSHRDPAPRRLGAVALCLVLSGAGSLTLEVVWTRYLRLVFGSTTLAISTVLVAYMLGLGLGGLAGGRWARRFRDGVRTYALFEIGIGLYALAVPWILGLYPLLNRFLLADLTFWPAAFVRFFLVLVALLLPTVLMGATLPILVEALVRRSDQLARSVGLLYGVNTLGAVAGVLATTFVLFPALGVLWSNNVGASLDVLAGVLALVFLTRVAEPVAETATKTEPPRATGLRRWNPALLSYGLVGLTSLTYEVCWTRSLSMVFGSSTHAFAAMLAAFLVGIAMGSLIGRRWFDRLRNPLAAYGLGLALLGVLSLVTLLLLRQLTDVFLQLYLWLGITGKTVVAASFMISILAMIGPTLVLGALFPLLTRAIVGRDGSASAAVGDVYFINTLGSATGAFLAGFAAVPWLGLTGTMVFAIAVNLAAGMAILLWQPAWKGTQRNVTVGALAAMLVAIVAWQPAFDRARMTLGAYYRPEPAIEMGVPLQPLLGHPLREVVYYRDGVNATVSVDHEGGGYTLRINGKPDASLDDMPTQSLSGHIPMLFGAPADSALVIGYASGVTAGAVSLYRPSTLDLVEIEPAVVEASHFFEPQNLKPLSYEKSRLILDDGRTYLTSTETKYDVVISEPSNPFLSGCSNLFTRDFFRSVRSHLNPGGRLFQWLQLYGMDPAGLSSLMAAITAEFPYVYAFHYESGNVDLLLYATDRPLRREDLPEWAHLPDSVREDLRRVSIFSTADLWSLLRLLPSDISEIARAATEINTDDSMFIELHAPWVLHESPEANLALLARFQQGVLGVAEAPGAEHLSAEQVGELAFAYALPRGEAAIGRRLAEEADRRGGSASAMVMRSELAQRESQQQPAVTLGILDEAVNLDPAAFWPRFHRGRLHYFLARYAEALSDADELAARYPHDTRGLQLRLRTLGALGRFQDAAKQAETLLASPRGQFEKRIWADAAVALAAVGQLEQGIAQMERFLAAQPFSPNEWNVLAEMYRQSGRAQDAERARANAGISERNQLLLAHRSARWEARFGSRDRAAALLKSILERDPAYVAAREDLESLVRRTATGS